MCEVASMIQKNMIIPRLLTPRNIEHDEIRAICRLKNQSWTHSLESQIIWWKKNTSENDLLVTLISDGSYLAFLRLRARKITVCDELVNVMCVTEVCVNEQHRKKGLGSMLMEVAASQIKRTNSGIAYLLCKSTQEAFYTSCGWHRTFIPLEIKSTNGLGTRSLAVDERCMIIDPNNQLNGTIVLFGDVF